jgi:hypothetical protein
MDHKVQLVQLAHLVVLQILVQLVNKGLQEQLV